jgi:reactive intermediate/imine deaminase
MKIEHIQAKDAPSPAGSYSHGVVANGFLYTCGMGPVDPATGKIVDGGVAEQTRQTLKNLQKILDLKGAKFENVVKVTVHLQDVKRDFKEYNQAYSEFFSAPFPVRTTVGSDLVNILVEIDFVVALSIMSFENDLDCKIFVTRSSDCGTGQ